VGWGGIIPLLTGPLTNKGKVRAESRVIAFKLGAHGELPPPKVAPVLPTTHQTLTATLSNWYRRAVCSMACAPVVTASMPSAAAWCRTCAT